jgi:hypothetical protein
VKESGHYVHLDDPQRMIFTIRTFRLAIEVGAEPDVSTAYVDSESYPDVMRTRRVTDRASSIQSLVIYLLSRHGLSRSLYSVLVSVFPMSYMNTLTDDTGIDIEVVVSEVPGVAVSMK